MNYKENVRLLKMAKQIINGTHTGLCSTFLHMSKLDLVNSKEHSILLDLIKKNMPLKKYDNNLAFYFEPHLIEPRIKYLHHLILLNNPNFFIRLYYKFKFRKLYS